MHGIGAIPSPPFSALHLGPLTVHAYALCILAGIAAAMWLGDRRWLARGGREGEVATVALWAVPFGIVGGRLYHVVSDPELYYVAPRAPRRDRLSRRHPGPTT
jgi:prolipoprotein diacylglyceryltransferase